MEKERKQIEPGRRCSECSEALKVDEEFLFGSLCMTCANKFSIELPNRLARRDPVALMEEAEIYLSLVLESVRRMKRRAESERTQRARRIIKKARGIIRAQNRSAQTIPAGLPPGEPVARGGRKSLEREN